jgi:hypothetical protein
MEASTCISKEDLGDQVIFEGSGSLKAAPERVIGETEDTMVTPRC